MRWIIGSWPPTVAQSLVVVLTLEHVSIGLEADTNAKVRGSFADGRGRAVAEHIGALAVQPWESALATEGVLAIGARGRHLRVSHELVGAHAGLAREFWMQLAGHTFSFEFFLID